MGEGFLRPFRAVEYWSQLFHGFREALHPWLQSVTPTGASKPEPTCYQH